MTRKIPSDAFEQYVAMGADRSYRQLAQRFGVSKRAITKTATRQDWSGRLRRVEEQARERSDERLAETLEEIRTRHLLLLKAMAQRAARGLQEFPLTDGMQAIRAAEIVIKLERLIAGDPGCKSRCPPRNLAPGQVRELRSMVYR